LTQADSSSSGSSRINARGLINESKSVVNTNLVSVLHDIQAKNGYLPEEKIREVAQSLGIPLVDVYGVATFYKSFSVTPRGRHTITVCLGTACHVRGSPRVLQSISKILRIEPGETTEDQEYSLETVNCLGCCALGPMVIADGEHYGLMNSAKVSVLLPNYKNIGTRSKQTYGKLDRALKNTETDREGLW